MRVFLLIISFYSFLISNSDFVKQRNVLYTQNLVLLEEKVALEYEKYLLTKFEIPSIADLLTAEFLGSNFSTKNIMGDSIDFKDSSNLKLKFGISKGPKNYMLDLYKRDLYRNRTSVHLEGTNKNIDTEESYVQILLKSDEAKNIHAILKDGYTIKENCKMLNKSNIYCNYNDTALRWYFTDSSWIEYSKSLFTKGNVTIKNVSESNNKLNELEVGTFVFEENGSKFIRLANDKIMKVE